MRWKHVAVSGCFAAVLVAALTDFAGAQTRASHYAAPKKATTAVSVPDMEHDTHFTRLVMNTQVHVYRASIAVGESTLLVQHPYDYLVVSLGANRIEAIGGTSDLPLTMEDGETQILTGGWPHKLVNRGPAAANLVIVELPRGIFPAQSVCGLGSHPCGQLRFGNTDQGRYSQTTLFETKTVRLMRAELGPGAVLPDHDDRADHLVVNLAGQLAGLGEPAENVSWSWGAMGTVQNTGTTEARLLIVEIK